MTREPGRLERGPGIALQAMQEKKALSSRVCSLEQRALCGWPSPLTTLQVLWAALGTEAEQMRKVLLCREYHMLENNRVGGS